MKRNTAAAIRQPIALTLAFLAAASAGGAAQAGGVSVGLNLGSNLGPPVLVGTPAYGYAAPAGFLTVGRGYGHRRGHHRGWGVGWGLVLAAPWVYPGWVLAQPQTVWIDPPAPPPAPAAEALPAAPSRPDPVIYPRNGQTAQQLEADRQDCNRWATTQPAALADASVFMRAVDACMDGRGYTTR